MTEGDLLKDVLADYDVVVFDLDGVLVDSNEVKIACMRTTLAAFGTELVEDFLHEFRRTFGRSRREHFATFHREFLGLSDEGAEFESFLAEYAGAYAELLVERYPQAPLCEHADRLVSILAARGVPLYVATGTLTSEAVMILDRAGLLGFFCGVLGGEEPKARRLEAILAEAGVGRRDAVLVGDSRQDALAADEVGMGFMLVTRYGFFPPEHILDDRIGRHARIVADLDPDAPTRRSAGAGVG